MLLVACTWRIWKLSWVFYWRQKKHKKSLLWCNQSFSSRRNLMTFLPWILNLNKLLLSKDGKNESFKVNFLNCFQRKSLTHAMPHPTLTLLPPHSFFVLNLDYKKILDSCVCDALVFIVRKYDSKRISSVFRIYKKNHKLSSYRHGIKSFYGGKWKRVWVFSLRLDK